MLIILLKTSLDSYLKMLICHWNVYFLPFVGFPSQNFRGIDSGAPPILENIPLGFCDVHVDVSKNRGETPKWMVKIMENPIKMDDLGGFPIILGSTPMSLLCVCFKLAITWLKKIPKLQVLRPT